MGPGQFPHFFLHPATAALSGTKSQSSDSTDDINTGKFTFTGTGTLVKSGGGVLAALGAGGGLIDIQLGVGGMIDVYAGQFTNGGWSGQTWTNNRGSLRIAEGAYVNLWDGNSMTIDSLLGQGDLVYGKGKTLTIGAGNNHGFNATDNIATFTGNIYEKMSARTTATTLGIIKTGTGMQILAGNHYYSGTTTVSDGILQFGTGGDKGKLGTGNVAVAAAGTLVLNTTLDNEVVGVLSGAGTVTQKVSSTLTLASAANTFTGTINMNAGTLQLGGGEKSGSLGASAVINMGNATALNYHVTGTDERVITQTVRGSDYAFTKTGTGTLSFSANLTPSRVNLEGGTLKLATVAQFNSTTLNVSEDSTVVLPFSLAPAENYQPQPWNMTLYKGTTATHQGITPTSDISSGVTVYEDLAAYRSGNVDTAFDLAQCADNTSNTQVRYYLPTTSTLSYKTNVLVTRPLALELVGNFDDRAGIFIFPLDENGNPDTSVTEYSMNFTSSFASAASVSLPAGLYQIDARVGDNAGKALASAKYVNPQSKTIGLGMREVGGGALWVRHLRRNVVC